MPEILILGGGICGLSAALLLCRDGHSVTLVERDSSEIPDSPQAAWEDWNRKGVAQFRQPHNFLPGLRVRLEAELPDLQNELREAGAVQWNLLHPHPFESLTPQPVDEKFWTYTARRPVGEWVFARAAARQPGLEIRRGVKAERLLASSSASDRVPHATGIRTAEGEELRADLVVDATGRGSRSPKWLAEIGARPPYEETSDFGFTYFTCFFHGNPPERRAPVLSHIGTFSILTLPGDNDTWSVTIFAAAGDKPLGVLRDAEKWTALIRACPLHAPLLEGERLTDPIVMGGMVDRYRRFVVDGSPVVTGFVPLADAWACTNPSAGRGITVGFIQALALRDELRKGLDDPHDFAVRYDAATERDVSPWYFDQMAADRHRFAEIEALLYGKQPPRPDADFLPIANLRRTMMTDPEIFRAALEYLGTITPLREVLARPEIAERMRVALREIGDTPPPSIPGPDREQLLAILG